MPDELSTFAAAIVQDIQAYGTLPAHDIRQIAACDTGDDASSREGLAQVLKKLRAIRGDDYLETIKSRTLKTSIVVTIEKH